MERFGEVMRTLVQKRNGRKKRIENLQKKFNKDASTLDLKFRRRGVISAVQLRREIKYPWKSVMNFLKQSIHAGSARTVPRSSKITKLDAS